MEPIMSLPKESVHPYAGVEKRYEQHANDSFAWTYIESPALAKYIAPLVRMKPQLRVLEAGCGHGRMIDYLMSMGVHEKNIIGIDNNQEFVQATRQRFPLAKVINGDIATPSFEEYDVDLLTCMMVAHHLDQEKFEQAVA
jgi:2-polyprenyl-3-methyl-5-hydroxy-6-metoxy-1,4-benzoquinol methylase